MEECYQTIFALSTEEEEEIIPLPSPPLQPSPQSCSNILSSIYPTFHTIGFLTFCAECSDYTHSGNNETHSLLQCRPTASFTLVPVVSVQVMKYETTQRWGRRSQNKVGPLKESKHKDLKCVKTLRNRYYVCRYARPISSWRQLVRCDTLRWSSWSSSCALRERSPSSIKVKLASLSLKTPFPVENWDIVLSSWISFSFDFKLFQALQIIFTHTVHILLFILFIIYHVLLDRTFA